MFKKIKEFFVGKPAPVVAEVVSAPYKMPEPPVVTPTLLVVETAAAPVAETVVETVVRMDPVAVALDLEPAALTPAKKPRKPRAPKAEVKPAAKKAPAKAKAPKLTVVKTSAKKPAAIKAKSKKV